jgi:AmmeMemoRadiSam system protein B/AmmeMemoRadiSam system protein A
MSRLSAARGIPRIRPYLAPAPAGFVVPHAGLIYSGAVAAAAFRHLAAAQTECVVLMGFSHHGAAPGAWIAEVESIRTPLGEVEVDREAARALTDGGAFRMLAEKALCDHSVELQLPLLQRAVPGARVVPVYVSHLDAEGRAAAARHLAQFIRPGAAIVASSDLTHYGRSFSFQPFPADQWAAERLEELDNQVIEAASSLSATRFLSTLRETGSTVCGYEPISLLLETLRASRNGEIFQETLDYRTSGDITGDFTHSVSYGALGYFPARSFHLGTEDQALLLESARHTLRHYVETGERKPIPPERVSRALERRAGAFVTLHSHGELRGCVGRRASAEPLHRAVPSLALAAALEDSRFTPVRRGEQGLEVEISVLSPFKLLADLGDFRVNEHGALLEAGANHGLLLPQVATERNWTAAQFLEALTRKTGVSRDVYNDPSTRVFAFRAQIIQ